jgi:CheY-like chemotaxis protein
MTEEQIAKVFKPYVHVNSDFARRLGGTGLGLPITKRLIELMGGALSVESAPGIGSKFSFILPFKLSSDSDTTVVKEEILMIEQRRPTFRGSVLVCEDNPINQDVIEGHLKRIGINPVIVENGRQGVDVAIRHMEEEMPFDVILMDIQMPIMDGLEASKELNTRGSTSPIVAMTANVMSQDMEIYLKHGIKDYLAKPFVAQELWICLMKFLTPIEVDAEEDMKYSPESPDTIYLSELGLDPDGEASDE